MARPLDVLGAIVTVVLTGLIVDRGERARREIMRGYGDMLSATLAPYVEPPAPPAVGSAEWLRAAEHELMIAGHELDCPVCIAEAEAAARIHPKWRGWARGR